MLITLMNYYVNYYNRNGIDEIFSFDIIYMNKKIRVYRDEISLGRDLYDFRCIFLRRGKVWSVMKYRSN